MAEAARRLIGDCSGLPFSVEEAERFRNFRWEPVGKISLENAELSQVGLRRISGVPVLTWPPALPATDVRGVRCGDFYTGMWRATKTKISLGGEYAIRKACYSASVHSQLEARIVTYLEACPFVVEIRTQYPVWNREKWGDQFSPLIPKSQLIAIDVMATLRIPGHQGFTYHAISVKPKAKLSEPRVIRRHEKEVRWIGQWKISHEIMTEETVPLQEYQNLKRLLGYIQHEDNIGALIPKAKAFALRLLETEAKGSLDRVLGMIGRRYGFSLNEAYALMAVAIYIGVLDWDHAKPLDVKLRMAVRYPDPNAAWVAHGDAHEYGSAIVQLSL